MAQPWPCQGFCLWPAFGVQVGRFRKPRSVVENLAVTVDNRSPMRDQPYPGAVGGMGRCASNGAIRWGYGVPVCLETTGASPGPRAVVAAMGAGEGLAGPGVARSVLRPPSRDAPGRVVGRRCPELVKPRGWRGQDRWACCQNSTRRGDRRRPLRRDGASGGSSRRETQRPRLVCVHPTLAGRVAQRARGQGLRYRAGGCITSQRPR
jgi:hypothetical protein